MRFFGILTMLLFFLSILGGWSLRLLKQVKNRLFSLESGVDSKSTVPPSRTWLSSIKWRWIINSLVISAVYLVVFIAIPSAKMSNRSSPYAGYLVFIVFYMIAMVSNVIYIGIDTLSNMVLTWAWARVLSGPESA